MATAEKVEIERAPANPYQRLAMSSLLGAAYVLLAAYVILAGLPWVWGEIVGGAINEFLSGALLVLVEIAAIIGVIFLTRKLEGPAPPHGSRAGIFFVSLFLLIALWIAYRVAWAVGAENASASLVTSAVIFLGLAFFLIWMLRKPGFGQWLQRMEDRGWFHATGYKSNQGLRVRRSTVVALLILGICGIIVMTKNLGGDRPGPNPGESISNDWVMTVPFLGEPGTYVGARLEQTDQGLLVKEVEPKSPAESAGLKHGDVITKVDDNPKLAKLRQGQTQLDETWETALEKNAPDQVLKLTTERAGQTLNLRVLLASAHPTIPLLYKVHLTLPLILAGLLIWLSWRVVNLPAFADFLIATEAEMNKVSWTTTKRLKQDTLVVLVTVLVLATFLFVIDMIWIRVLSWRVIGVLQVDIREEALKQQEKTQW
jgi:preprotein translocase SecE subunit